MVRGGTHIHGFFIPFNYNEIRDIYITYSQKNKIVIEKKTEDCTYNEQKKCVQINLSQTDTLSFAAPGITSTPEDSLVIIQVRLILNDESAYVSVPIKERLFDSIKEGEI